MLNYITTGESHGKTMAAVLEGMPSGLSVDLDFINDDLARRQAGYGRGGRQRIECDKAEILGGVIRGVSTGAPIGFLVKNEDFKISQMPELFRPRPGHADLAGALKYHQGIRAVLERASARETVMRVAAGSLCRWFLKQFAIEVVGHVVQIGKARLEGEVRFSAAEIRKRALKSSVACVSPDAEKKMLDEIDAARRKKDSVGGQYEVRASGVPIGLGSYVHHTKKLDGRIAHAVMGMQSVKAVEIGSGTALAALPGSAAHDEIFFDKKRGYYRKTNRAGGIEGGMTNGADLIVRATMKPIATLGRPLASVNMATKKSEKADFERADICAVPAGSVIGEALAAFVIADAFLEKFGGDSMTEIRRNYEGYLDEIHG